jgi:Zn-dependent protease with chaperone function
MAEALSGFMRLLRNVRWLTIGFLVFLCLGIWLDRSICLQQRFAPARPPENNACFETVARADELFLAGDKAAARDLYRQCKPDFPAGLAESAAVPEPVYDVQQLSGGQRLWANALDGIRSDLDTKTYFNLVPLTRDYPHFIPAQVKLADFCMNDPEFCEKSAKEGQPKTASEVLASVTELYPDNADLVRKKVELLAREGKYLEASIDARQYSIVYADRPEAAEFVQLSDRYLDKFKAEINDKLVGQAVTGALIGVGTGFLTGSVYQGLSGLQMVVFLLQGETAVGAQTALAYANQFQQQGKLLQDEEVSSYIRSIGDRITRFMGRKDLEYDYFVVKDDTMNAFALPGGKIFINTGAILNADSEAELAGLMGHEIAHSVLSHGFLKMAQASLLNNLGTVLPFFNYVSPLINARYSQESERQADILGTRALPLSNYAADGLHDFMVTMKKEYGDRPTNYLASHPAPVERVAYIEKFIQDNGYDRFAYEGVKKHAEIQARLRAGSTENT